MSEFLQKSRTQLLEMPNNTPYTVNDVAVVLQMHPDTVKKIMATGGLKFARVSSGRRVLKEWVFEYLHSQADSETRSSGHNSMHS